jgi:hypothetical protein
LKSRLHIVFFSAVLFSYLLVHVGVPVFKHYCGGELESISAFVKSDICCGEEEEESSDCCDDEMEISQLQQDLVLSKLNKVPAAIELSCFISSVIYSHLFSQQPYATCAISGIPFPETQQRLELNCTVLRV